MFFSTELLSRRDSGYGLLWLAATLGSKSKKLLRRSVLTADIEQLCSLISEPPEPLALRLSSNLLVGVARVYKLKHEIFHTDVGNCFTSLKKTLQELHAVNGSTIDMAQPSGLREEALNLVPDPGMAMLMEFDGNDLDWDIVFRKRDNDPILDDGEFDPAGDLNGLSSSFAPTKRKLHQLDESHEHLFSASFLNSLSGEVEAIGNGDPSSSANDVLFGLDFEGDPDVGLGEEMMRDLEEAWNLKPQKDENEASGLPKDTEFEGDAMDLAPGFVDDVGAGIDFGDDAFNSVDIAQIQGVDHGADIVGHEDGEDIVAGPNWSPGMNKMHTPPPHNKAPPRSCFSRKTPDIPDAGDAAEGGTTEYGKTTNGRTKKPRKKVILIDPRIELTDEQLKFQMDNYPSEMKRLRREARKKKELREGKRHFEELLWEPPKDFVAPELIEWYNQRVVYPVKASEAQWRKEPEEVVQSPKKRARLQRGVSEELREQPVFPGDEGIDGQDNAELEYNNPMEMDMGYMGDLDEGGAMDVFEKPASARGDPPSGSRRSSDSPGHLRRRNSPRASPFRSSQLGQSGFNLDKSDIAYNSLFPWDHAGPSSSNAGPPGSFGVGGSGGELGLSLDYVRIKKSSRSGSRSDSPLERPGNLLESGDVSMQNAEGPGFDFEASLGEGNFMETQESESMVTLEKNSFNFLGYAKMHKVSNAKPLFFSDLVPTDSSSARVAAEGFYHCLALATKDLISLEQPEPYGPIKIQIK